MIVASANAFYLSRGDISQTFLRALQVVVSTQNKPLVAIGAAASNRAKAFALLGERTNSKCAQETPRHCQSSRMV